MRDENRIRTILESLLDELGIPQEERERLVSDTAQNAAQSHLRATEGYFQNAADVLAHTTECTSPYRVSLPTSNIVTVRSLGAASTCAEHLQPMSVSVKIAYIPKHLGTGDRRTVPVGNMARLVKMFARRLTTPESIARSVADALIAHVEAQGVMVKIATRHHCICGKNQFDDGVSIYCAGTLSTGSPQYGSALDLLSRQR